MKGSENVIAILNQLLHEEFMGFLYYFVHCKIWEHWGDQDKYQIFKEKARQKKRDADKIIERILSLEGVPLVKFEDTIFGILNVEEQFRALLDYEQLHRNSYLATIELCIKEQDIGTKLLIEKCLPYVERNIVWLELQLSQIGYIGLKAYIDS
jgi:bacterioferritin